MFVIWCLLVRFLLRSTLRVQHAVIVSSGGDVGLQAINKTIREGKRTQEWGCCCTENDVRHLQYYRVLVTDEKYCESGFKKRDFGFSV